MRTSDPVAINVRAARKPPEFHDRHKKIYLIIDSIFRIAFRGLLSLQILSSHLPAFHILDGGIDYYDAPSPMP